VLAPKIINRWWGIVLEPQIAACALVACAHSELEFRHPARYHMHASRKKAVAD
jgi:hypothetical protein